MNAPRPRRAAATSFSIPLLLLVAALFSTTLLLPANARYTGRPPRPLPKSDRLIVQLEVPMTAAGGDHDAAGATTLTLTAANDLAAATGLEFAGDLGDGLVVLEAKGQPGRAAAAMAVIEQAAARARMGQPAADDDAVGQAVGRARVAFVEEDFITQVAATASECPSGTSCPGLWGMTAIKAPQMWALSTRSPATLAPSSAATPIGVIDTGVQYTHAQLDAQVVQSVGRTYLRGVVTGNGSDDNGHGTHCAGVIGAEWGGPSGSLAGVNGLARVMACKSFNASGSGFTSDHILCIKHLSAQGAVFQSNSWTGGSYSSTLFATIRDFVCNKGGLFVAAAGNSGRDIAINNGTYPAFYSTLTGTKCVLPVAATNSTNFLATFSNWGSAVPIAAPGVGIKSAYRSSTSTTLERSLSGTSMATPAVAGVAVFIKNDYPSLTGMQIKQALVSTATTPVKAYLGRTIGGGLLNAEAAYRAAASMAAAAGR
jgi:hypothetical protein